MKATAPKWYGESVFQFNVISDTNRIVFFQVSGEKVVITEPELDSVYPLLHYDKPVIEYIAEYLGGGVTTYPEWMNKSLGDLLR